MELDIEKIKVVGIVEPRLTGDYARIRVIGYIDGHKKSMLLAESELKELFPTKGYIFEPYFYNNFNFREFDLISFRIKENEIPRPDGDNYRICTDKNYKPKLFGDRVFEIRDLHLHNSVANFSQTKLKDRDEDYSHGFFAISGDKIIGKLKIINGRIEPEKGHVIRSWDINECNLFEHKGHHYLIDHPGANYDLIDTMDSKEAFKWFKGKINILNSEVVSYLNNKTNWRNQIPDILTDQDEDENKVDKIRLQRVCANIDNHSLLVEDIKELAKTSENLQKAFLSSIETHKLELRSEYESEIAELEKSNIVEKEKLAQQLSKIEREIDNKNERLNDLNKEIILSLSNIEQIKSNKDRILSDFKIIKDVLGNIKSASIMSIDHEESFVVESIKPTIGTIPILRRDKFSARLKYYLNDRFLNSSICGKLITVFSTYKGIFLGDAELGLSFIEAVSNSNYIIQHVEPDWLHFNDLWRNGLDAIWRLSHENPDQLNFLILEDVNMSSPECYMRPLLDCMNGIRKQIPFAKTAFPENLRIIATKISSDEPKIGLPLYQQTFRNWGAIGFADKCSQLIDQNHPPVDGYLDVETFFTFKSDEPIEDYSDKFKYEFNELFDYQ